MTNREQAAMLTGFVAALVAVSEDRPLPDMALLKQHVITAKQILTGGAYNPLYVWEFQEFMRKNFRDPASC